MGRLSQVCSITGVIDHDLNNRRIVVSQTGGFDSSPEQCSLAEVRRGLEGSEAVSESTSRLVRRVPGCAAGSVAWPLRDDVCRGNVTGSPSNRRSRAPSRSSVIHQFMSMSRRKTPRHDMLTLPRRPSKRVVDAVGQDRRPNSGQDPDAHGHADRPPVQQTGAARGEVRKCSRSGTQTPFAIRPRFLPRYVNHSSARSAPALRVRPSSILADLGDNALRPQRDLGVMSRRAPASSCGATKRGAILSSRLWLRAGRREG
jgi:hypothetical protein